MEIIYSFILLSNSLLLHTKASLTHSILNGTIKITTAATASNYRDTISSVDTKPMVAELLVVDINASSVHCTFSPSGVGSGVELVHATTMTRCRHSIVFYVISVAPIQTHLSWRRWCGTARIDETI